MQPTSAITNREQLFIDEQGRQVLLHGIALVDKDPKKGYLSFLDPELFATLRQWGFNCIRLGVIWDGLEPEPGVFNETYLKGIDRQIELATMNDLYVFLDMHQDLYSVLYSDGAPEWATLTNGAPHFNPSEVWSDAYFSSPAVQIALDAFWDNALVVDGIGLQEHYAKAWGVLAQRYAGQPMVIGYDMMNEPFPGSMAVQAQEALFAKGAEILADLGAFAGFGVESGEETGVGRNPTEDLMQVWLTPEGRFAILQFLRNLDIYIPVIDVQQPFYNQFEQTKLMDLYTRVAKEIRRVDPHGLLFLETTMASNMGVISAIQPIINQDGMRDPHQVYAPHGYDLVTDTPYLSAASPERVELIFNRHAKTAKRLSMPMLVGEWGAFGDQPETLEPAWQIVGVFERLFCSETFWAYFQGIDKTPSFPAVQRPYPECVAGKLSSYHFDPISMVFTCEWDEDGIVRAPSRIYLPNWLNVDSSNAVLTPRGTGFHVIRTVANDGSLFVEISPVGKCVRRRFTC